MEPNDESVKPRARLFTTAPRTDAGAHALQWLESLSAAVHEADERALQLLQLRSVDALALQQIVGASKVGETINPTQLAGRLRLTTAAITKLVDRLVHAGRAERRPNPVDRRGIVLVPTDSAVGDLSMAYGHVQGPVLEVLDGLTDDELTTVGRFAQRLSEALHRESGGAGLRLPGTGISSSGR